MLLSILVSRWRLLWVEGLTWWFAPSVAILTSFFFPLRTLFDQSRKILHGQKDIDMLAKRLAACTRLSTTVSKLFEPQLQKIAIFTYDGLQFLFALGTPLWQSRKTLHDEKTIQCLPNSSQHVPTYLQQFPSYSNRKCKNSRFHLPQPTFLFPLETPLRLSRNMLHGWKDNSMLAKRLAACTYLSWILSELYDA